MKVLGASVNLKSLQVVLSTIPTSFLILQPELPQTEGSGYVTDDVPPNLKFENMATATDGDYSFTLSRMTGTAIDAEGFAR